MQQFNTYAELIAATSVSEEIKLEVNAVFLLNDLKTTDTFNFSLGGPVCLLETINDIHNWKKELFFGPYENFDLAYYLPSGEHALLFEALGNEGGPTFFIPRDLYLQIPNIQESIKLSNEETPLVQSMRGPLLKVVRVSPISGNLLTRLVPIKQKQISYMKSITGLTRDENLFLSGGYDMKELAIVSHISVE